MQLAFKLRNADAEFNIAEQTLVTDTVAEKASKKFGEGEERPYFFGLRELDNLPLEQVQKIF